MPNLLWKQIDSIVHMFRELATATWKIQLAIQRGRTKEDVIDDCIDIRKKGQKLLDEFNKIIEQQVNNNDQGICDKENCSMRQYKNG